MEKDFYTDGFEQLLKDTTYDFRMYPSRKVWHSIYNDLHPARKWPSFAVCLLLITCILYVGINNNNDINADTKKSILSTLSAEQINTSTNKVVLQTATAKKQSFNNNVLQDAKTLPVLFAKNLSEINIKADNPDNSANNSAANNTLNSLLFSRVDLTVAANVKINNEINSTANIIASEYNTDDAKKTFLTHPDLKDNNSFIIKNQVEILPISISEKSKEVPSDLNVNKSKVAASTVNSLQIQDKEWIDNDVFYHKRIGKKWKSNFSTSFYITPSIGYRVMHKNNSFEPVNALLIASNSTTANNDNALNQQGAINLETGGSLLLGISKKVRLKAGLQFNYTNYITYAQKLNHPTQTTILLNDLNTDNTLLVPYSSIYANNHGNNNEKLHNKTIQFSLPIGADYKLAGNNKIKWYVGTTIQPSYTANGNAYLISSDYKNYVNAPDMLRKWNVNAAVESFISFKTKSGADINLGPQFRYQLLSAYSKQYTYTEKLYNIGFKLGITKKL